MTASAYHARAGLAYAGVARAGYFLPNVLVFINDVDVTEAVQRDSLDVSLERNDEPSSARFTMVSRAGIVPTAGQLYSICLGWSNNPILAGQITETEHTFENDGESTPWVAVTCGDWAPMFNRLTVTYDYTGWAADDAAIHLVQTFTSGFTYHRITRGLDTLEDFACVNEEPLSVLRRMATSIGGGCKIEPLRHVRLWGSAGESGYYAPSPPETLVPGLWSLKSFVHGYDVTQWRSRVICEGKSTTVPKAIPAGTYLGNGLPLTTDELIFNDSTHPHGNYARIGSTLLEYIRLIRANGPPVAVTTADAAAGDTTISVVDNAEFVAAGGGGWLYDENGNYFKLQSALGGTPTVLTIPAAGNWGALLADAATGTIIPAGSPLYMAHSLDGVEVLNGNDDGTTIQAFDKGAQITVRMIEDDAAAQAVIAAVEGEGDGVHEHSISGDLTHEGCSWAAREELNQFASTLPKISWLTEDMNALPGVSQDIAIPLTGGFTDTVIIERVTMTFPSYAENDHGLPLRQCEGSSVKLQGILDMILAQRV